MIPSFGNNNINTYTLYNMDIINNISINMLAFVAALEVENRLYVERCVWYNRNKQNNNNNDKEIDSGNNINIKNGMFINSIDNTDK